MMKPLYASQQVCSEAAPLIVEFAGGVGNQLFQYVFGYYFQQRTRRPLLFDATAVDRDVKRSLQIVEFEIDTSVIIRSRHTLFSLLGARVKTSLSKWEKIIDKFYPYNIPGISDSYILVDEDESMAQYLSENVSEQRETMPSSQEYSIIKYSDYLVAQIHARPELPVYVRGYWQYSYFAKQMSLLIKKTLRISQHISTTVLELAFRLLRDVNVTNTTKMSCSLHIRREDYLSSQVQNALPSLDQNYITKAVSHILDVHPQTKFYIFSDDPEWCRTYLDIGSEFSVVTGVESKSDIDDLLLMNCCTHHILANSSFSWWGANLPNCIEKSIAPNQEGKTQISIPRITIAPKVWFSQTTKNTTIHMEGWVLS